MRPSTPPPSPHGDFSKRFEHTVPISELLAHEPELIKETILHHQSFIDICTTYNEQITSSWQHVHQSYNHDFTKHNTSNTPQAALDTIQTQLSLESIYAVRFEQHARHFLEGTKEHEYMVGSGVEKLLKLYHDKFTATETGGRDLTYFAGILAEASGYNIGKTLIHIFSRLQKIQGEQFRHGHLMDALQQRVETMEHDLRTLIRHYEDEQSKLELINASIPNNQSLNTTESYIAELRSALFYTNQLLNGSKLLTPLVKRTQQKIHQLLEEVTPKDSHHTSPLKIPVDTNIQRAVVTQPLIEPVGEVKPEAISSSFREKVGTILKRSGLFIGTLGIITGASYALKHTPTTPPTMAPSPIATTLAHTPTTSSAPTPSSMAPLQETLKKEPAPQPTVIKTTSTENTPVPKPSLLSKVKTGFSNLWKKKITTEKTPQAKVLQNATSTLVQLPPKPYGQSVSKNISNTEEKRSPQIRYISGKGHLTNYTKVSNSASKKTQHYTYFMSSDAQFTDLMGEVSKSVNTVTSVIPVAYATDSDGQVHRYVGHFVHGSHGGKIQIPTGGETGNLKLVLEVNGQVQVQIAEAGEMGVSRVVVR